MMKKENSVVEKVGTILLNATSMLTEDPKVRQLQKA